MMKKIILLAACLAVVPAGAEELKFVTALSQPVASFARLEAVNNTRPAEALFVNFCNTGVSTGNISAKGLVKMNEMRLTGDSQLGSPDKLTYQITNTTQGLALRYGGSLRGAKLLAKTANPQDITVDAGVALNNAATFVAADLPTLNIATHTKVVPSVYSKNYRMEWDDSYTANYRVSGEVVSAVSGKTYNSYLLRYRVDEHKYEGEGEPPEDNSCKCPKGCPPQRLKTESCGSASKPNGNLNLAIWQWSDDICDWVQTSKCQTCTNWGEFNGIDFNC